LHAREGPKTLAHSLKLKLVVMMTLGAMREFGRGGEK
jgi:hypothetical protein